MKVSVVIGACYGDEGKGLLTDFLASPGALVIRFNGGPQAGHTVVTPTGVRHVHHHFGSGTLRGAPTFLSRFFIANPILFGRELGELSVKLCATGMVPPVVYIDPAAMVTTPWDMMLNTAAEQRRAARHGSCGVGINETVTRHLAGFPLTRSDMARPDLREMLIEIRDKYVRRRIRDLGLAASDMLFWDAEGLINSFVFDAAQFAGGTRAISWPEVAQLGWSDVVFEGAQGLRLDEFSPDFPHVTRSRTGLTNVKALLEEAGLQEPPDVYYVTRTYATRHGAGPFPYEIEGLPAPKVRDNTNVPHAFQGALRFGRIHADRLVTDLIADRRAFGRPCFPRLAVTCADQTDERADWCFSGTYQQTSVRTFASHVARRVGLVGALVSHGPTREDVARLPLPSPLAIRAAP